MGDTIIAAAHNCVLATHDITAHAEIAALRMAGANTKQIHYPGALVASTCEPCPMCMAALHWARVEHVVFGATIADAEAAGFNELRIPAADIIRLGGSSVKLTGGVLVDECAALFAEWKAAGQARPY